MKCNVPRLREVPRGKWECCECHAVTMKKKQRCGECDACIRPNCGKCTPCLHKKMFGGSGKYGKSCKQRQCPDKRYARPEQLPATSIQHGKKSKQNGASIHRKRSMKAKHGSPGGQTQRLDAKRATNTVHAIPPGPGWQGIVTIKSNGKRSWHWRSPALKHQFKNRKAADQFESMIRKCGGDERLVWKKYVQDIKACGMQLSNYVLISSIETVSEQKKNGNSCHNDATKMPIGDNSDNINWTSFGWKVKKCPSSKTRAETHFITPVLGVEFRSMKRAKEFFDILESYEHREEEMAMIKYVHCIGIKKIRNIVSNYGRFNPKFGSDDSGVTIKLLRPGRNKISSSENSREGIFRSSAGAQQIISKRKKNSSLECRNTCNVFPPGPGWEFKVVHNGTKNIKYWLSPCLKLQFKNHKEAVHFVSMVQERQGDENLAWKKYAQDVKASGRQMSHFVLMGALPLGGKQNRLHINNVPTNAKKRAAGTRKSNKSAGQQTNKAPSAFNCDYVVQSPFLSNMPAGYDRNSAHYKSVRVKPKVKEILNLAMDSFVIAILNFSHCDYSVLADSHCDCFVVSALYVRGDFSWACLGDDRGPFFDPPRNKTNKGWHLL